MKQECPTYLKTIRTSKTLAATLCDTQPEDDSDNEDDGIRNAFTATMSPTKGIDEEEDLGESKFEQVSKKHEKLYRLATKNLNDVELKQEEISTKFNEANQTIRALRFENNFLAEKTKKLETKLFQVRAQLERTSSVKLDEMLSFQKSAFNRTDLRYDYSSPNIASSSTTIFVSPVNNVESENNDKGKSILGAPPKFDKKETKNSRTKKGNTQKPKQKKQHLCHHCGATKHTRPNCYKWLATQQSNSMISSGNQNQFPSSFAHLGDLLKTLIFLSNLNGFNSSPSPPDQGFAKWKGSSKV